MSQPCQMRPEWHAQHGKPSEADDHILFRAAVEVCFAAGPPLTNAPSPQATARPRVAETQSMEAVATPAIKYV